MVPLMNQGFEADDQRTREYFAGRAASHGNSVLAVDWGSEASQAKRFEVLASAGIGPTDSVLDVGCGLGSFRGWLGERGFRGQYLGVDLTEELLTLARQREPGAEFRTLSALHLGELGRTFDVVVASGIFYLRRTDAYSFMDEVVRSMWARATKAVAFNTLSAWAPDQDKGEFYAEPGRVLDLCRPLTTRVTLRHDYHPRDFTVVLSR